MFELLRLVFRCRHLNFVPVQSGAALRSRYTKPPTPTPRFLKLRLRLIHKISICINNGKPIRRFITTT
jgi:hypothetical protein